MFSDLLAWNSPFFWLLCLVEYAFIAYAGQRRWVWRSHISLLVTFALLILFGDFNPLVLITQHPITVFGYFVFGFVIAAIYWGYRLLWIGKHYKKKKEAYIAAHPGSNSEQEFIDQYDYVLEKQYHFDKDPRIRGKILFWALYWPTLVYWVVLKKPFWKLMEMIPFKKLFIFLQDLCKDILDKLPILKVPIMTVIRWTGNTFSYVANTYRRIFKKYFAEINADMERKNN